MQRQLSLPEIAVFVLNLSDIIFLQTAPHSWDLVIVTYNVWKKYLNAFSDYTRSVTHFTPHLLSDSRVGDSSPLACLRERTCELDTGAFLHYQDSKFASWVWQIVLWKLGNRWSLIPLHKGAFCRRCWKRRDVILFSVVRKIIASRENRGELLGDEVMKFASNRNWTLQVKGAVRGGLKGLKPPLSNQNIDVYFLSFSPTLYCKSRSGALQNVLWQYHGRSNTFVIKPSGYEFLRFEKYWSSFLHSCVFCATIYNKNWVLPCSASVETSMTFELPIVSIDV